jgi:hypothetical protein
MFVDWTTNSITFEISLAREPTMASGLVTLTEVSYPATGVYEIIGWLRVDAIMLSNGS